MDQNPPLPQVGERDDEYIKLRVRDDALFRARLCDWLRANGINPNQVPPNERPSLVDGKLTLQLQTLSAKGNPQIAPDGETILTHTVTVPMVLPPDGEIARWLVPPCTKCGR